MPKKRASACVILSLVCAISMTGCRFWNRGSKEESPPETASPRETAQLPVPTPSPETVPDGSPETWAAAEEMITPEIEAEIRENVIAMESKNPMLDVIWFRIDCHDGKTHIYYSTKNMNLQSWLKTEYNEERWQAEGDKVVNEDCTLYIANLEGGLKTIIHNGDVFDTDIYTKAVAAEGNPEALSGASMEDYIENFVPGVEIADGCIIVKEKDANNELAYETVYDYDNGLLEEIIVVYYCRDEAVDSYREYLENSGMFKEVVRQGNILSCYKPDEEAAKYADITRGAMYQMLLAMSEGKEYVEVFDETGN